MTFALMGFIGFPRVESSIPQSAERFPCEKCPCGCSTAEHCWNQCCCHSDTEKLEWAKRNNVVPPTFLVQRVAQSKQRGAITKSKATCCQRCTSSRSAKNVVAVCGAPSGQLESAKKTVVESISTEPAVETERSKQVVLMWKAAQCRGLQAFWSMLMAVYIPVPLVDDPSDPPLVGWIASFDEHASGLSKQPDPPVP